MSNVTSAFITTSSVTYETLSANGDIGAVASTLCAGNDGRLSDARTPVSHDNTYHSSAYITTSGVTRDALYANSGIGIADNKVLEVDDATAADNDYAKFTANGIEGRTYTEVKTDLSLNNVTNVEQMPLSYLDTDGTLAANSDAKVASQKATKTYCDQLIASGDVMVYKGEIDCSTNPNYPAADRGHTYMVSVAGKIGGASGEDVEAGDIIICIDDATASGTEAAVGSSWVTIQANLNGAVIGAASSTDNAICRFDNTTGKLIQNSSATIDDNGSVNIPTGQTYKINASTVVDQSVANGAAPVLAATNFTSIKCEIGIAVSDELTDLTVGAGKVTFRMPYAMTLTAVRANVNTAPTGSTIIVDINEAGATIMTTNKLSIDATELTSVTAATPAGLTDTALADDAVITIDIDQIGSTIAGKGLKVWLIGVRA
jgi:hypothetical protein